MLERDGYSYLLVPDMYLLLTSTALDKKLCMTMRSLWGARLEETAFMYSTV